MDKTNNATTKQKGVSILLAVIILSLVLAIGLGMSILFVRQVKGIGDIGHSVKALYAADTGIEKVLFMSTPTNTSLEIAEGLSCDVTVYASTSDECDADNYCITSIGMFSLGDRPTTTRALEINY